MATAMWNDSHDSIAILLALFTLGCITFIIDKVLKPKHDPKEPPFVPTIIPYFGHILGLFWHKNKYYINLRARHHLDIYSLAMPGGRMYVVNSPDLVHSIQRQPRIVSFWFIEAVFTAKLGMMSNEAGKLLLQGVNGERDGTPSLLVEGLKVTHRTMMPGETFDQMLYVAVQEINTALGRFDRDEKARRIDLWDWSQHEITIATTASVYGPKNPFQDPMVEKAFWDFSDDTVMLLTGFMPNVLASKGQAGREKVVSAFEQYFASGGHENGSGLAKARLQVLKQNIRPTDIARFECVNGIAILSNSVPTTFWTLYHIFSDPAILEIVREQLSIILSTQENKDGTISRTIDLGRIKEVPILSSILQESLRYRSSGVGSRMLLEDVVLENRYLLKKGSFLIIPSRELHFDPQAWGSQVDDFNPYRFLKSHSSSKTPSVAFRGFGGGVNSCPGKAFATSEITALIAIFVLRYDMKPAAGSQWIDPGQDFTNMSLAIAPPKKKVIVDIVPRKGLEGGPWAFRF